MGIKVVLFDLDGTLLPMNQDAFIKCYFGSLAKKIVPHGYDKDKFIRAIIDGCDAMVKNDGRSLNSEVFFEVFKKAFGERVEADMYLFDEFYENDFDREVRRSCGFNEQACPTVREIRAMGYRVVLATNPLFPSKATESRISWAGLEPSDFELYTTYDNSRYCKPNLDYYRDIVNRIGVLPEECLMVGNDVDEDMIAENIGMKVFLMPTELLNRTNKDITKYPQGDFSSLIEYIKNL